VFFRHVTMPNSSDIDAPAPAVKVEGRVVALALSAMLFAIFTERAFAMDLVRTVTRIDEAVQHFGVTGAGVTIVILDRGIDWTHPDFRNPDGTTRIKWLLDMSNQTLGMCAPGNPMPIEYTESQINAALDGGPAIASRDAVGHGSSTAGIAAGNGSAFADGKYRGVAPNADLVIVKLVSEGAPAHDGQPAETSFQGCIGQAMDWLDQKIDMLGQPCAALINSGTQWGPMDGTSAVSRKIDEVFGLDRPGRVFFSPSGDEGTLPTHAGGEYDASSPTVVAMTKFLNSTAFMSIWYTGSQPAQVTVTFNDGTSVGPVGPGSSINQNGVFIIQYAPGLEFYPWQSTSGDRAVWIRITGHSGPGTVQIRGTTPGVGRFDFHQGQLPNVLRFDDHLVPGRLTDYASTLSAIVAAAHVVRTSYFDINGIFRSVGQQGATGQLWQFSAGGPTRDGRIHGVDVSAPGHNCFAAYAPHSYWATIQSNLIQDGGGWYGRAQATSASAPIVLGTVALMLERGPNLTGRQVRNLIRMVIGPSRVRIASTEARKASMSRKSQASKATRSWGN
jgi:subtilisin family serine protease